LIYPGTTGSILDAPVPSTNKMCSLLDEPVPPDSTEPLSFGKDNILASVPVTSVPEQYYGISSQSCSIPSIPCGLGSQKNANGDTTVLSPTNQGTDCFSPPHDSKPPANLLPAPLIPTQSNLNTASLMDDYMDSLFNDCSSSSKAEPQAISSSANATSTSSTGSSSSARPNLGVGSNSSSVDGTERKGDALGTIVVV